MPALPGKLCVRCIPLVAAAALTLPFHGAAQPPASRWDGAELFPASRVVLPVDDGARVTLGGNVRPEASSARDLGPVSDSLPLDHMQLLLARSPEQQRDLEDYLAALNDRNSPGFHRWLTPEEFGDRFGVSDADIDAVHQWLAGHSLTVNSVYPSRMMLDFSGTAAQVRAAFAVEMHAYDVDGQRHIANDRSPSIPLALASVIAGVVSLHDFAPLSQLAVHPGYTSTTGSTVTYPVTPADLAVIYNLAPAFKAGYTGKGQTIVVIENSNVYSTSDWTTFRAAFGLSTYTTGTLTQVHPAPAKGGSNCVNPGSIPGLDVESIVDAEYSSAAAPAATIELASCASTGVTFGGLIALQNLLNSSSTPPAIVSISFGECEASNGAAANAAYNAAYQQAAAEGVSVFVSAGDSGASNCDAGMTAAMHGQGVNGFASTPYNVAVGATDFSDTYSGTNSTYWSPANSAADGSARSYVPEIPWNDSCAGTLLAGYDKESTTWGSKGFCNTGAGEAHLTVLAGGGGPSACAAGAPSAPGVASGTCKGWAKPAWQSITGNPKDSVRDLPDVSLFAGDGLWRHYYLFCNSDTLDFFAGEGAPCSKPVNQWVQGGGTSFAAPIMAGIQALVDQKYGRQGNPNPVYYKIAAAASAAPGKAAAVSAVETASCQASLGNAIGSSCVFNDITQGDTDVACMGPYGCYQPSGNYGVLSTSRTADAPAYAATAGWDFATGIGSVNAYNLLMSPAW
jgi:subtilase family serine protease